jgi:hypothetical protein
LNLLLLQLKKDVVRSARMCGRINPVLRRLNPGGTGFADQLQKYDHEARTILQSLFGCRSEADVRRAIRRVFGERFGSPNAFSLTRFSDAAREIWSFWNDHHPRARA